MNDNNFFSPEILKLDPNVEVERISASIRKWLTGFRRKGCVIGLSGGIDSSVTAALCVQAVGKQRVLGLLMPEKDSSQDTLMLSRLIASNLGIEVVHEEITPILEALGCYRRRDEAVKKVLPTYDSNYTCKIVLPSVTKTDSFRIFSVVVVSPEGKEIKARLTPDTYLGIVAASNFKQRTRKMLEYYHADRLNYAVAGTPNLLEYDQGFFVKNGDGAADIKPIAHLYKTQVYQLAEYLDVPEQIRSRPPTTDTYSAPQTQDEFYFSLTYDKMDLCLYGKNHKVPIAEVARATGLSDLQVKRVFRDIEQKRKTTEYLHLSAQLLKDA